MSYSTIYKSTVDDALRNRIVAAICKEAWENSSQFSNDVKTYTESGFYLIWAVCVDQNVATAYSIALETGNLNPGGDESVITDEMILSIVKAVWP